MSETKAAPPMPKRGSMIPAHQFSGKDFLSWWHGMKCFAPPVEEEFWSQEAEAYAGKVNRELLEALENAFVIIEGLQTGTKWEIAPTIKATMAEWSKQTDLVIRRARGAE